MSIGKCENSGILALPVFCWITHYNIKEIDKKEYEFKTKLFMNFFASNPVKKQLIQKQNKKMKE